MVEGVGNTVASQWRGSIDNVEMQMWFGRVAGVAEAAQHLPALYRGAKINFESTRLDMGIERINAPGDFFDHVVARNSRHRDRSLGRTRDVVLNSAPYIHNSAVRYRKNVRTVGVIVVVFLRVAFVGSAVGTQLYKVNGEALGEIEVAVCYHEGAAMSRSLGGTVTGQPIVTPQRRTNNYRRGVVGNRHRLRNQRHRPALTRRTASRANTIANRVHQAPRDPV